MIGIVMLTILWTTSCYRHLDKVQLYVNKVYSQHNVIDSHSYYSLPFCKPKNIYSETQSLGQQLQGDIKQNSIYQIQYKQNIEREEVCRKKLTEQEKKKFIQAIDQNYLSEYFIDDILQQDSVGIKMNNTYLLKTHLNLTLYFNRDKIIYAKISNIFDSQDYSILEEDDDEEPEAQEDVVFKYTVNFVRTSKTSYESFLDNSDNKDYHNHLFAISISMIICASLGVILFQIFKKTVLKDIYNIRNTDFRTKGEVKWRSIRKEILAVPYYPSLLSSLIGIGQQLLFISLLMTFITIYHLYKENTGELLTYTVLSYCFTGFANGYISSSYYVYMNGRNWLAHFMLTSLLLPSVIGVLLTPCYFFELYLELTLAIPLKTISYIVFLVGFINIPLVLLGCLVGKTRTKDRLPVLSNFIYKTIPQKRWFRSSILYYVLSALVPALAVSVEVYYILQSIWEHRIFHLQWIVFVLILLVLGIVGCVNIVMIYFTICDQDYQWWWKSFIFAGSFGTFFFGFSVVFFFQDQMTGLADFYIYLSYSMIFSVVIHILLGSWGFICTHKFIRTIYEGTRIV